MLGELFDDEDEKKYKKFRKEIEIEYEKKNSFIINELNCKLAESSTQIDKNKNIFEKLNIENSELLNKIETLKFKINNLEKKKEE